MSDVTQILSRMERGDPSAADQLLPLVYEELRRLAAHKMAQEAPGHSLNATALVHEAYIRLVDHEAAQRWNSRGHFFGAAAEAMRRILVENARRKRSIKRGGGQNRVELLDEVVGQPDGSRPVEDILAIDEALDELTVEDPTKAALVKLKYFAGLSTEDAAEALGMSRATACRYWTYARTWLYCRLEDQNDR